MNILAVLWKTLFGWLAHDDPPEAGLISPPATGLVVDSGLFQPKAYLDLNPDVAAAGADPLQHFVAFGLAENRRPNPYFDAQWYLRTYPDVAADPGPALLHYVKFGAAEGRRPGPGFDPKWYLDTYPDVAAAGVDPLRHFLEHGRAEGRRPAPSRAPPEPERSAERYLQAGEFTAAALLGLQSAGLTTLQNFFLPHRPIAAAIDSRLNATPSLRILLPSVRKRHATGGPNTAYHLGCLLARQGVRIVFASTDIGPDEDLGPIKAHLRTLTGIDPDTHGIAFEDASDRSRPYPIGTNDVFLATAWWTAHAAAAAMRLTRATAILYLVQDYETLLYAASEAHAGAEATYDLPHLPIVNTSLLRDHLVRSGVGRFADPDFAASALVFEPAVDSAKFHPVEKPRLGPRRLLFYARPTVAERNLFGLGVTALRAAVGSGLFEDGAWEFVGMGEPFEPVDLGRGHILRPAPWLDFDGYAEQMRGADVLLSLMLSPHPSYPPLEMAACGGVTVTTTFGSKDARRLRQLSPDILGVAPRIEELMDALSEAVARAQLRREGTALNVLMGSPARPLPTTWQDALSSVTVDLVERLRPMGCVRTEQDVVLPPPTTYVRTSDTIADSPRFYVDRLEARRHLYRDGSSEGLVSLVTTVYDTDATFLVDLAHSVFGQDTALAFEWLILDNGSSNEGTLGALREIVRHPRVRLVRVAENLGIVGGMRWCLAHATGRYILPLDSDDLLFPDCLRAVTACLEQNGFPPLLYTNEDKTNGGDHVDSYVKPDWDPVLFTHSCYVAHITAIDRKKAIEIGCYSDDRAEGCHDWDTFTRFMAAGIEPVHLPEILYSWRMHEASTSANYKSKGYIYESHRFVLERFMTDRGMAERCRLELSPLFGGTPDYRFVATDGDGPLADTPTFRLPERVSTADLASWLARDVSNAPFVHLLGADCDPVGTDWRSEAATLIGLFPDTVVVGGRLHDGKVTAEAGYVFGYGPGIGCPDAGRAVRDSGYFIQMWKPRSVGAVSARHCVVERSFLAACLGVLPAEIDVAALGLWLGGYAARRGRRVIYTPFLEAITATGGGPSQAEVRRFNGAFGDLAGNRVGYAEHLDRSGDDPYGLSDRTGKPLLPAYGDDRPVRDAPACLADATSPKTAPTITIITTVYERTDPELFALTARSVRDQSRAPLEWLILAHGPIPGALAASIAALSAEGIATSLTHPVNLGIQGGLRHCLERAAGDFVLSLDADDLLTPDAVARLSRAALATPDAAIFYSDEDLLIDGEPCHPFYRPDFDPALLLAHSFAWHAILFQRTTGLELGVYSAPETEYAQDWDTLVRFHLAGRDPVHVPAVLYHWRQHAASLSNSGTTFEGSLTSVRAVLNAIIEAKGAGERCEVVPYPVPLGAPDLYIRRRPIDAPALDVIRIGASTHARPVDVPVPMRSDHRIDLLRGPEGIAALGRAAERCEAPFILLIGAAIVRIDEGGLWQAFKHLEFLPGCAAVGGCLVGFDGLILAGPSLRVASSGLTDPFVGRSSRDPGHFSIAQKPHSVDALVPDLLVVRRDVLRATLEEAPAGLGLRGFGGWLGRWSGATDWTLTYEPLLRGLVDDKRALVGDPAGQLGRIWAGPASGPGVIRGQAGFLRNAALHA